MVNVGLTIGSATPRALAAPRTNGVFPAPPPPGRSTTPPPERRSASFAPAASVSAGPEDRSGKRPAHADPQADAGDHDPGAQQRQDARIRARACELARTRGRAGRHRARELRAVGALG